ncbi:MAG: hypothetical protein WCR52_02125 [Bacteroidota bacterium]
MEFDALKDLIQIITRNKVKNIEILGNPGPDESRTEALYDGISKGKWTSDDQAANFFFGSNEKDPNYKKLRNKLVRQLINTSLFIDVNQPMFNERSKALYNCYRDFAAANILHLREANKAAVYLMEQILEQSMKYEFTELVAEITRFLRMRSARSVGDRTKHEYYTELHQKYEEKRRLELKALDYYETLINYYIYKRSPNDEVHKLASAYYDELSPLSTTIDTSQFYYHTFQIGIIKYMSINDCKTALKICETALETLQRRKNTSRSGLSSIAGQKLACLTQLRIFGDEDGERTAQFTLSLSEEGSYNWFRTLETYFQYNIYTKQYERAIDVYKQATLHPRFNVLNPNVLDKWQLYGGYLHLLAALGKLTQQNVEEVVGPFKFSKFTNEFEVFDKDKEGMNIPLTLLPMLFSIAKGEDFQDTYGRSLDALEKYRKRYLDIDMNRRSASFLNILMALGRLKFEQESAERKIKKEVAILERIPLQVGGQSFAVEVIPYEDLWEMLKTTLKIS